MSKTLKSVKIDDSLIDIIDKYLVLKKSIIGESETFTSMVEEGVYLYLQTQMQMFKIIARDKIIMDNGILKKLRITEEQLRLLEDIDQALLCRNECDY